ncbi:hypothetical protein H8S95_15485 [Pontibacter sp. KCTC 32443]|uniref:hypothetical protein n=1 Tax=Pontibacter TaxID=323449 RepID=UPI00164E2D88|nr:MULTISPECIES: hypothetical protein [Pontibacter]MBC5775479.1 hypothetical protein [Pontibacter sp. KCTC 32443]
MFISLYTNSQIKQLKRNILILGVFLTGGAAFALARELFLVATLRFEWLLAAALVLVTGIVGIAVAQGYPLLKEAYFSMNPSRVSYRLTLFGREYVLPWSQVAAIRISENAIVFELRNAQEVTLRLSTIPDEQAARHIRASIGLAALEQNIYVNGVLAHPQTANVAS